MKNKNQYILKFKNENNLLVNKLNEETIKNSIDDIEQISRKLKNLQKRINKCVTINELNNIQTLKELSDDLGLISLNSIIIDDSNIKQNVEETNRLYRETEILFFNKKIDLLNEKINNYDNKIDESLKKSEENIKDITGGTLFSIASVFLGISLTSALVSGVGHVDENYIILYFITCLLISITTIGISAIFMRKFDKKSIAILLIIASISIVWIFMANFSYKNSVKKMQNYYEVIKKSSYNKNNKLESCNMFVKM